VRSAQPAPPAVPGAALEQLADGVETTGVGGSRTRTPGVPKAAVMVSSWSSSGWAPGLLALMLLTHARRDTRISADGALVALAQQDRRRWDQPLIAEGIRLVEEALPVGTVGPTGETWEAFAVAARIATRIPEQRYRNERSGTDSRPDR